MMGVPDARVDELLTLVGLDKSAARKRVRQYSLGMRQRLGLAHALLGDPQVLILDEPANGLDPEGIRWMRGLLRDFADRGGTVLLSSHLLLEVEAVADRLLIIGNGKIVAAGSSDELLAGTGVLVRATDLDALERALDGFSYQRVEDALRRRGRAGGRRPRRARRPGRPHPPRAVRRRRPGTALLRPHGGSRMNPHVPTPHARRAAQDGRHPRRLLAAGDRRRRSRCSSSTLFCIFGETDELIFRDMFALAIVPREPAAADRRHPARDLRVDAAHGADHLHARAQADAGDERQARGRARARR